MPKRYLLSLSLLLVQAAVGNESGVKSDERNGIANMEALNTPAIRELIKQERKYVKSLDMNYIEEVFSVLRWQRDRRISRFDDLITKKTKNDFELKTFVDKINGTPARIDGAKLLHVLMEAGLEKSLKRACSLPGVDLHPVDNNGNDLAYYAYPEEGKQHRTCMRAVQNARNSKPAKTIQKKKLRKRRTTKK